MVEIDEVAEEVENIQEFINSGDVVLLCGDLEQLEEYGIFGEDIEIVEKK